VIDQVRCGIDDIVREQLAGRRVGQRRIAFCYETTIIGDVDRHGSSAMRQRNPRKVMSSRPYFMIFSVSRLPCRGIDA
jgi:hypothetical protein